MEWRIIFGDEKTEHKEYCINCFFIIAINIVLRGFYSFISFKYSHRVFISRFGSHEAPKNISSNITCVCGFILEGYLSNIF